MKTIWYLVFFLLAVLLYVGCGERSAGTPDGSLVVAVEWPASGRLIPQAANSIEVKVRDNAAFAISRVIARPAEGGMVSAVIEPVPVGMLTVTATAYPEPDATGTAQATGSVLVTTSAGERTPVSLNMASTIVSLTLIPSSRTIDIAETFTIMATPRDAADNVVLVAPDSITWQSSGAAATVNGSGLVTGVSAGNVVITARESESGVTGTTAVTVRPEAPPPPAAGGRIAFVSDRDGASEIYVMNADGGDQRRLTTDRGRKDEISISRDGRRITFVSNRTGRWHVYVINADGTGLRQVTDNGRNNWRPSFSPDGDKLIYFSSISGGNDEIYSINLDGTGETRLTTNTWMDVLPVYTPDGAQIVFGSNRTGSYQLFDMHADGENERQITTDAALKMYHDVSPDGDRIAVTYGGQFVMLSGGSDMYAYVAGGRIATMSRNGDDLRLLTGTGSNNDKPAYSPDGEKIAFSSNRDGQWEIYVMNSDGTGQTRLTNNTANDWFPAWGPLNP